MCGQCFKSEWIDHHRPGESITTGERLDGRLVFRWRNEDDNPFQGVGERNFMFNNYLETKIHSANAKKTDMRTFFAELRRSGMAETKQP